MIPLLPFPSCPPVFLTTPPDDGQPIRRWAARLPQRLPVTVPPHPGQPPASQINPMSTMPLCKMTPLLCPKRPHPDSIPPFRPGFLCRPVPCAQRCRGIIPPLVRRFFLALTSDPPSESPTLSRPGDCCRPPRAPTLLLPHSPPPSSSRAFLRAKGTTPPRGVGSSPASSPLPPPGPPRRPLFGEDSISGQRGGGEGGAGSSLVGCQRLDLLLPGGR
jgi:hypothetical protein